MVKLTRTSDDPVVGGTPSGQAMPTSEPAGWTRIFADDFNVNYAEGAFLTGANVGVWTAYPDGWDDSSNFGFYTPNIISTHDGMMDIFCRQISGVWRVAAPYPVTVGGNPQRSRMRISVRMKADRIDVAGFKVAWLTWPVTELWPQDGELDFPEGSLDGLLEGYMHRQDATVGSDQDYAYTGHNFGTWHTCTIEWEAGVFCRYIIDGVTVLNITSRVPNKPMRYVMQCETRIISTPPPAGAASHIYCDWITVGV